MPHLVWLFEYSRIYGVNNTTIGLIIRDVQEQIMTISQLENEIRQLPKKDQLQLLSWLAQYIGQTINFPKEKVSLNDIEHPLEGTLLSYDAPFEPVAVDDWDSLQ